MASLIEPLHPNMGLGQRSPSQIANEIIESGELPLFVRRHSGNRMHFVAAELIRYHFETSGNRANRARSLLSAHLSREELERYGEEEWRPSS